MIGRNRRVLAIFVSVPLAVTLGAATSAQQKAPAAHTLTFEVTIPASTVCRPLLRT